MCRTTDAHPTLPPVTLSALARRARQVNAAHGFPAWSEDGIPLSAALIHTEVTEAYLAHLASDEKALVEELADISIRALDTAEGIEPDALRRLHLNMDLSAIPRTPLDFGYALLGLHADASALTEMYRRPERMPDPEHPPLDFWVKLVSLIVEPIRLARFTFDVDLLPVMSAKIDFNATRPLGHGNKRL